MEVCFLFVLVTGTAGFIGYHTTRRLLINGHKVIGLDNMNEYYDVTLKRSRLALLREHVNFHFVQADLADHGTLDRLFSEYKPTCVCNLAAQAGVRYSLENPFAYQESNLEGFLYILEQCRQYEIQNLVYASSSSVYGSNTKIQFSVEDRTDNPISLYAATKKANELMAHSYHHLFDLNCTGLRFFTVYGPWGRPDMALFKFTKAILEGQPIDVYNHGQMQRDFTYIDDIVDGVVAALERPLGYEVLNLGNSNPVALLDFIACLEDALGLKAKMNFLPMQAGDVPATFADIAKSTELLGYLPKVSIEEGIPRFVRWYREYYGV